MGVPSCPHAHSTRSLRAQCDFSVCELSASISETISFDQLFVGADPIRQALPEPENPIKAGSNYLAVSTCAAY